MAGPDRDIAARTSGDGRDPAGSGDDRCEPDRDRAARIGPQSDRAGAAEGADFCGEQPSGQQRHSAVSGAAAADRAILCRRGRLDARF